jgi:hypothetical protein
MASIVWDFSTKIEKKLETYWFLQVFVPLQGFNGVIAFHEHEKENVCQSVKLDHPRGCVCHFRRVTVGGGCGF